MLKLGLLGLFMILFVLGVHLDNQRLRAIAYGLACMPPEYGQSSIYYCAGWAYGVDLLLGDQLLGCYNL